MMSDQQCYWHIAFTEERLAETQKGLLDILDRHASEESNLSFICALVMGDDHRAAMTDISAVFWDDYEATLAGISRADITTTDWDKQVAAFTPDEPCFLQDFVSMTVLRGDVR